MGVFDALVLEAPHPAAAMYVGWLEREARAGRLGDAAAVGLFRERFGGDGTPRYTPPSG